MYTQWEKKKYDYYWGGKKGETFGIQFNPKTTRKLLGFKLDWCATCVEEQVNRN